MWVTWRAVKMSLSIWETASCGDMVPLSSSDVYVSATMRVNSNALPILIMISGE